MDEKYLLDTTAAIAYLNNDLTIRRRLRGVALFLSAIVVGELFYGALFSDDRANNLNALRQFIGFHPTLPCDVVTSERYGLVVLELRRLGKPLPINDTWIAAHALQHNLRLLTRDAHFDVLKDFGLHLETW